MRLKYKKLIILFTVAIMFIGLGTFSLIAPSIDFSFGSIGKKSTTKNATMSAISDMTDDEIDSDITTLVSNYLDAKQRVDMDELANCVSDISHVDEKRLVTEAQYIEEYKNIDCTIKEGQQDGTYRVYVYYEVKVYDIDTLVPSLSALYVTATEDGTFQIYLGTLDGNTQKYIDKLDSSSDIKSMVTSVQKSLEDLVSTNEDVRAFYEMLESDENNSEATEDDENIDKEGTSATAAPNKQ